MNHDDISQNARTLTNLLDWSDGELAAHAMLVVAAVVLRVMSRRWR